MSDKQLRVLEQWLQALFKQEMCNEDRLARIHIALDYLSKGAVTL